jgi:hypothetical protein
MDQILIQRLSSQFTDAEALVDPLCFELWAPGMRYGEGQIIRHADGLFRLLQTVDASAAHQPPDAPGLLAVYRPIVRESLGTRDDPIVFVFGMDAAAGRYYAHDGRLWLCKGDMLPCVWPPGTPGLWQWEPAA